MFLQVESEVEVDLEGEVESELEAGMEAQAEAEPEATAGETLEMIWGPESSSTERRKFIPFHRGARK